MEKGRWLLTKNTLKSNRQERMTRIERATSTSCKVVLFQLSYTRLCSSREEQRTNGTHGVEPHISVFPRQRSHRKALSRKSVRGDSNTLSQVLSEPSFSKLSYGQTISAERTNKVETKTMGGPFRLIGGGNTILTMQVIYIPMKELSRLRGCQTNQKKL